MRAIRQLCVASRTNRAFPSSIQSHVPSLSPLCSPYRTPHYSFSSSQPQTTPAPVFSLDQLKELRSISGAPLKECKKALENTTPSETQLLDALDWLRIRGQAIAQQKSGDVAQYGFVALCKADVQSASLVEVNCVTDFVENNAVFQSAVLNIGNTIAATHSTIAANQALDVSSLSDVCVIEFGTQQQNGAQTVSEALTDIVSSIRENLVFRRAFQMRCSPRGVIGAYLHGRKTSNLGMKGALVSLETDVEEQALDEQTRTVLTEVAQSIATHVVANCPQPKYVCKEDMTREQVEKEKELILQTIMEQDGEAAQNLEIVQKKIDGRMKKFFVENVLMEQPFCLQDDNKLTVAKLLAEESRRLGFTVDVAHMVVYNLGEA